MPHLNQGTGMRRREFISFLGGATAMWPLGAPAQQPGRMRRIGMLMGLPTNDPEGRRWVNRFIQTLRELGWRNGDNVQIDLRWGDSMDQIRTVAKQLVELNPDLIHVTTAIATAEVLRHTKTIPVVFSVVNDPVAVGFTQSLERPTGNATGFSNVVPDLSKKWLELLKEIAPGITRVAVLFNPVPGSQVEPRWARLNAEAASLGMTAEALEVRDLAEIEKTIAGLAENLQTGLVVIPDAFFNLTRSGIISSLVTRHRVVAVYPVRDFVDAGGLASYSVDIPDLQRRAAGYADRILKGETPSNLPVEAPRKFELIVNLKSAKAIGLTIPPALRARATEVIE
jgi:ABC-type uncharacterized transport system substrate-binding protein